ncbi:MAG: transcription antitermination factor NusB [Acidobacteriota bacterium]
MDARGAHAARLLGDASPFERELVLGALRWQGTLDALLAPHLRDALSALDPEVRAVLRAGLYEASRLDTPVPVAVAEAVRVAKELVPRASGLVNAVLRRAASSPWPDPDDERLPLALRFSHPEWLVRRWTASLGAAAARAAVSAGQHPAPLTLYARVGAVLPPETGVCRLEPHPWVEGVAVVRAGAEAAIAALRRGSTYAIDPAAVAVARLLPAAAVVADLAAAPGGKSLVLASERAGTWLVSCDRHFGRASMMVRTLGLAARRPAVVVADGSRPALRRGAVGAVLLDAPCSGTGTLRRHPEIRWRLRPDDLPRLAAIQRDLASAAAALLAPGGHLLYSTCSLEPEENEEVIAGVPLEVVPLRGRLPDAAPVVELDSGGVALLPSADSDGFTVHLLRRPA